MVPAGGSLAELAFAGHEAWLVGDADVLLHSTDDGAHFTEMTPLGSSRLAVVAADPPRLFVAGEQRFFATSSNGGATFTPHAIPIRGELANRLFVDGELVLVGGSEGLARSTDGGESFAKLEVPLLEKETIAGLGGARTALLLVTHASRILRSTDRGATWEPATGATSSATGNVVVIGAHAWVRSTTGDLLHSADGGRSWSVVPTRASQMNAIWATPNGVGLAGDGARILWLGLDTP